jgi:hypothetical protein
VQNWVQMPRLGAIVSKWLNGDKLSLITRSKNSELLAKTTKNGRFSLVLML